MGKLSDFSIGSVVAIVAILFFGSYKSIHGQSRKTIDLKIYT